jgi:hypothetical protein
MTTTVDDKDATPLFERLVVRRNEYHDPVTLNRAAAEARSLRGVRHVAIGMVTPLNLVIFDQRHGYDLGGEADLGPNDLVMAVRADNEQAVGEALAVIDRYLADRRDERQVVDVGPYVFVGGGERRDPHVEPMDPPAESSAGPALERLAASAEVIGSANDAAVARMQEAKPLLVGVATARDRLADMGRRTILHAGPPIDWADMSSPLRGAIIGALLFEGLASDPDDAVRRAEAGEFEFAPGHERGALGPMAGVISASMPVWIVENDAHGNRAHCTFSEGLGQMLRFGAYNDVVIDRLRWIRDVLAPVMTAAVARLPQPLDIRDMTAQAVQMGDEGHNRLRAGNSLFLRALAPVLVELDLPSADVAEAARFISLSDYFYLNLSMPSAKVTADVAAWIEHSTVATTMARNGTEFGVRVSGTGDRWFVAPSREIDGCWLPGYEAEDANLDMGDSTITETIGLGGFALAAAPAIGTYVGASAEGAIRATLQMYEITWAESQHYRVPALGFRGTPVGIDCRKVVQRGILPILDTGIAHREAGVGVIGGGIVRAPMEPFVAATRALAEMS